MSNENSVSNLQGKLKEIEIGNTIRYLGGEANPVAGLFLIVGEEYLVAETGEVTHNITGEKFPFIAIDVGPEHWAIADMDDESNNVNCFELVE